MSLGVHMRELCTYQHEVVRCRRGGGPAQVCAEYDMGGTGPRQRRDLDIPSHLHLLAGRRHGGHLLLLVSLLVTTILSAAGKYLAPYLPETAMQLAGSAVSLG